MLSRIFLVAALFLSGFVSAQPPTEDQAIAEMKFLVGTWMGQGWMNFRGQQFLFNITEVVAAMGNGSSLQIEGISENHRASTTLSFAAGKFRWLSYATTPTGNSTFDITPEVGVNTLVWQTPKNEKSGLISRFTITLNEKGQWFEIGEQSSDGSNWEKFLEQTLTRTGH